MCKQKASQKALRCNGCNDRLDRLIKVSVHNKELQFCSGCLEFIKRNGMMRNVLRRDAK
jgi:hypothetical protein